eukprot:COSAG02_NODE_110_length_36062_cov_85.812106_29_plen_76_part_00
MIIDLQCGHQAHPRFSFGARSAPRVMISPADIPLPNPRTAAAAASPTNPLASPVTTNPMAIPSDAGVPVCETARS